MENKRRRKDTHTEDKDEDEEEETGGESGIKLGIRRRERGRWG
jgi:hypothetical protein